MNCSVMKARECFLNALIQIGNEIIDHYEKEYSESELKDRETVKSLYMTLRKRIKRLFMGELSVNNYHAYTLKQDGKATSFNETIQPILDDVEDVATQEFLSEGLRCSVEGYMFCFLVALDGCSGISDFSPIDVFDEEYGCITDTLQELHDDYCKMNPVSEEGVEEQDTFYFLVSKNAAGQISTQDGYSVVTVYKMENGNLVRIATDTLPLDKENDEDYAKSVLRQNGFEFKETDNFMDIRQV